MRTKKDLLRFERRSKLVRIKVDTNEHFAKVYIGTYVTDNLLILVGFKMTFKRSDSGIDCPKSVCRMFNITYSYSLNVDQFCQIKNSQYQ